MRYTISLALASLLATSASAEVPAVVTDIPPVHSLVAIVMGDLGTPDLLLDRGADPHDFQLRPSQARAVADAGLVVWMGPAMSPWLDRALDGAGGAGAQLALLTAPGTITRGYADKDAEAGQEDHDHAAEEHESHDHAAATEDHEDQDHAAKAGNTEGHNHVEEAGTDDHAGHDHGDIDPHAWLDPRNAQGWLTLIGAELSRLDPANAATYAANAAAAADRIAALDAAIATRLAPIHDRPFIVYHDAFGYFTGRYDLTLLGAIAAGDAASPGAQRIRTLTGAASGSACVFPEANHDPDLSAQVAQEAGVKLGAPLDPEGATLEPGADLYPAMLTGMVDALTACLGQD